MTDRKMSDKREIQMHLENIESIAGRKFKMELFQRNEEREREVGRKKEIISIYRVHGFYHSPTASRTFVRSIEFFMLSMKRTESPFKIFK